MSRQGVGIAGRLAGAFIHSKLTPLFMAASVAVGAFAVAQLPREEEPQIIVPMIDVFTGMPGASAEEIEERLTRPVESLMSEIPGVEYVYSTSSPDRSMVIVRFEVGWNEEDAILRVRDKLAAHGDGIPEGAQGPLVKPRSIDDVPVLSLTLWSRRYDDYVLRRIAGELRTEIEAVEDVSEVTIIGGRPRTMRVIPDPERMAARNVTPLAVMQALQAENDRLPAGSFAEGNREFLVETGTFLEDAEDVASVVVGATRGRPVFVRDVARVADGAGEPTTYVRHGQGPAAEPPPHDPGSHETGTNSAGWNDPGTWPAVTLAVAKRSGTNAIDVVESVLHKVDAAKGSLVPEDVQVTVSRDYGETANEKSNELLFHMAIAVFSVALLIWFTLGLRESAIVLLAIPVTLALTLTVFWLYGYTLNRITLFALIFSIGILVDDAIVVVENISRHYRLPESKDRPLREIAVRAVAEVGNPTILATMTVIAAILPMAFVSGLMGPYMRPIPVGASAAMVFSLLVAFVVTPWAAIRLLKSSRGHEEVEGRTTRWYRKFMGALLATGWRRWGFLALVVALLLAAMSLVAIEFVEVKMLPFDNKAEFQVVVDMPEGTTLEQTDRVTRRLAEEVREQPEVMGYQTYVGTAGPYTFSGLVRHYFLRSGSNVADVTIQLTPKHDRDAQSHDVAQRLREAIQPVAKRFGARAKVVEVPPGPPVIQTLVAEIYGPDHERQIEIARDVRALMEEHPGVVDVDWEVEHPQPKVRLLVDEVKAALHGVDEAAVARTLRLAMSGAQAGLLHSDRDKEEVPVQVRLDRATRSDLDRLGALRVASRDGRQVSLAELVKREETAAERSIQHKNLKRVVYVTADLAGETESPVYAILDLAPKLDEPLAEGYAMEQHTASQPFHTDRYSMKWDGEWHITYEVFRDLGLAFAAVLILIYVLVVAWFQSFMTPLIIMSAIPFSLVGILPAHGLMGAFFTATSMIGFIAGAGIVVRNSIILVDFIELRLEEGVPLRRAVVDAGAVRFRPMLLTAAAVMVGAGVILFDPIFQGLAISLIAGEVASLALSRMTVPVIYFMVKRHEPRHREEPEPPGPTGEAGSPRPVHGQG
ncbi:MAG: efflux RND transporter permease subunit [Myxococcota bacterium]